MYVTILLCKYYAKSNIETVYIFLGRNRKIGKCFVGWRQDKNSKGKTWKKKEEKGTVSFNVDHFYFRVHKLFVIVN